MLEKKKAKQAFLLVIGVLFGGFIGWALGNLVSFDEGLFEALGLWWTLWGLVAMVFFAILLHELGHVIGGKRAGFQFAMLVVGPIKIVKEQGRLQFKWNTSLGMAGGLALMLPKGAPTRQQLGYYILGGPSASWIGAIVLVVVGYIGYQASDGLSRDLFSLALMGALISASIGCATLIPSRMGGFDSDGAQWRDVKKGGHRAERKMLMYAILGESMRGIRPRDWEPLLLDQARSFQSDEPSVIQVALAVFLYQHYLDAGDTERARVSLDRAYGMREAYPGPARGSLHVEAAYFKARYSGNREQAEAALAQAKGGFVEKTARLRAESAIAWLTEHFDSGKQRAEEALTLLKNATQSGNVIAEKAWLQSIIDDCKEGVPFQND